ncbi:MAG: MBL fold metallo-hydrolase [Candidatus Hodarchaeales archaeon]|jgi:glyoxylase-like metal-dependent hydrolase (beta-lactamase superfamily II)
MLEKISDSIYAHTKGKTFGNVGAISTEKGNFLIDTSMYPVIASELRVELEKIKTGKVKAVILTHYHGDHTWGSIAFKDKHIYGHHRVLENFKNAVETRWTDQAIKDYLESEPDKKPLLEGLEFHYPDKLFDQKQIQLEEDSSITVHHVGGHTNGSSLIHYQPENVVFAGDNFFNEEFPYVGDPSSSIYDWIVALEFIKTLKPAIIIPGHGDVDFSLTGINNLLDYFVKIRDLGEKLVKEGLDQDSITKEFDNIDFYEAQEPEMKKTSLNQIYQSITNKIKS